MGIKAAAHVIALMSFHLKFPTNVFSVAITDMTRRAAWTVVSAQAFCSLSQWEAFEALHCSDQRDAMVCVLSDGGLCSVVPPETSSHTERRGDGEQQPSQLAKI